MNKKFIVDNMVKSLNSKENLELIEAINDARIKIDDARQFFDNVCEPKLIDYAIYTEDAAKARYGYLINQAKAKGVKVK